MKRLFAIQLATLCIILCVTLTYGVSYSAIVYVDSTATGANIGTSWANAFTDLQDALGMAGLGDEIWVAAGTYFPTPGVNRTLTFQLVEGVGLYGGFAGTETARSQRNFVNNKTILSGNIGADTLFTDNSYHVVNASNVSSATVIDGFTVERGNADGAGPTEHGGGIYVSFGDPTISNMILSRNNAFLGGGLYVEFTSAPLLTNVTFSLNDAASLGGGMFNETGATPDLVDCFFDRNDSDDGAGVYNQYGSNPTFTNVVFDGNDAGFSGGAMYNLASDPVLVNVVFTDNTANEDGGAVYNSQAEPEFTNVSFSENVAGFNGGAMFNTNSFPYMSNCIVGGNTATLGKEIFNNPGAPLITNCLIEGSGGSGPGWDVLLGLDGGGNIDGDPAFVDAPAGDLRLTVCSPAINAGANDSIPAGITTDLDGNARIIFGVVDMGAYESLELPGLIVYVNKNAMGMNDGTSWANAYNELRDALANLTCTPGEIWVAAGTYMPTAGTDETATFQLLNELKIYGGFTGTETAVDQRDYMANTTILSGDIGVPADSTDNSDQVVTGSNTDATAVLDGFTVMRGNGRQGAGLVVANGSPTISNVVFRNNTVEDFGGASYNLFGGSPTFTNVLFFRNKAKDGGAMCNDNTSHPQIINCTFNQNNASAAGGAIDNVAGSGPIIMNSIFWDNTAVTGPEIRNTGGASPVFSYCDVKGSGGSGSWNPAIGTDGGNNVDINPSFVNAPQGNLRLNVGSPVIDAGNNALVPAGVTLDLDNNPRISAGTVDLGPYEAQSDPTVFLFPQPLYFQTQCDTLFIKNVGGTTLNISQISGCGAAPFAIDTSMTAHVVAPGDSTSIVVCIAPPAGIDTCYITLISNADNSPSVAQVILDVITAVDDGIPPMPFQIVSVAPNPFNPTTTVHFTLPATLPVTTEIWSVTGARVRVLSDRRMFPGGNNSITWDGRNDNGSPVASGVYFVRMRTPVGVKASRAVLLK